MLKDELNLVIVKETEAIRNLLGFLDEQYTMLIKNDIFGLEGIVENIQLCNKEIAESEMERRRLTKGDPMNKLVNQMKDKELEDNYRAIKRLLEEVKLQKDTNEMLIRQGLGFSTRMLNIMNPDRNIKTYNSYGKIGR
jgi:hypothetical protein